MSLARKKWNPKNKNHYRGYYPIIPGITCYKEGIGFSKELPADDPLRLSGNVMYEPNQWPPESEPGAAEFKQFMMAYHDNLFKLSVDMIRLLAIGIGKEENYFDQLFLDKSVSTLRPMHYPLRNGPIPATANKDGQVLTCLEHCDSSYATFLCIFQNEGLQILMKEDKWIDVKPHPDCLLMNAGEALVKTAGKRFIATKHRVVEKEVERYSVPFFLEPAYFSDLNLYEENEEKGSNSEPLYYGPWILKRMVEKNFTDFPTATYDDK